jgi:hypothetical protein
MKHMTSTSLNRTCLPARLALAAAAVAAATATVAVPTTAFADTTLVEDTFTPSDARLAGSFLHNSSPETSYLPNNKWVLRQGGGSVKISSAGVAWPDTSNTSISANIAIPAVPDNIISVSATITFGEANVDWFGIGFLSEVPADTSTLLSNNGSGSAWLLVRANGTMQGMSNGPGSNTAAVTWGGTNSAITTDLGAFDAATPYTFTYQYNPVLKKGKIMVNGYSLYAESRSDTPGGWFNVSNAGASLAAASFQLLGKDRGSVSGFTVDDFLVTTGATLSSAIPEPATTALASGCGILVVTLVLLRKRTCR